MERSTLDELLQSRGTNMSTILSRKEDAEKEMQEIEKALSRLNTWAKKEPLIERKRKLSGIPYILQEFLNLHDTGTISIRKDGIPTFEWNPYKESDGYGRRSGGWEYTGKYFRGDFYSLWVDRPERYQSLIYLCNEGKFYHLWTPNKKSRFEIIQDGNSDRVSELFERNRLLASQALFPIREGDICTSRGAVLLGESADYARAIFEQVQNGVEIFPEPEELKGYRIPSKTKVAKQEESEHALEMRTFGQEFLKSLSPTKIIEGELFGTGHSYKAFVFGNRIVVESDEEQHATYFLSREQFETLRQRSRRELLTEQPEGFLGRAIHPSDGQDSWKDSIARYVQEKV